MTLKETNISKLYKARSSHIQWVNTVKLLVSGIDVNKLYLSPIIQESPLGQWFYSEAMLFAQFNSQNVLDEMEELLESMYAIYTKIYSIYYGNKKSSIKELFGFKSGANEHEMELASRYYEEIVTLSDQFKNKLKLFERQLMALSDEKHESIKAYVEEKKPEPPMVNEEAAYYYGPRSR